LIDYEKQRTFVPIDHERIFNSGLIDKPIYHLTYEESIISTPLFKMLLGGNDLSGPALNDIKSLFFQKVHICEKHVSGIIKELPADWKMNNEMLEINFLMKCLLKIGLIPYLIYFWNTCKET
jgi:hypothetical protein